MDRLKFVLAYLDYFFKADNIHNIHSPLLYNLHYKALKPKQQFSFFKEIKALKKSLFRQNTIIDTGNLGAGSQYGGKHKTIRNLAKQSGKASKPGECLFKLVHYFQPQTIVELGTSLGISTCYLAAPCSESTVYTIEGNQVLADVARRSFQKLNLNNIRLINGYFDKELPLLYDQLPYVDFLHVDGNHQYKATLKYYELSLAKMHEDSIFVFDDINWSDGMRKAWREIKNKKEVTLSLDLFRMGIVFFKNNRMKQDFKLKF